MIRKAKLTDIKQIQQLINGFAKKDLMLPRSLNELYESIRDFWIAEEGKLVIACCALHISWETLAEIKSLAVTKNKQGRGIAKELILACLGESKALGAKQVFVLTYKPEFFRKFGFKRTRHENLPHKIWAECINCCKFPDCQEIALVKQV